jgi:hypothetical protein
VDSIERGTPDATTPTSRRVACVGVAAASGVAADAAGSDAASGVAEGAQAGIGAAAGSAPLRQRAAGVRQGFKVAPGPAFTVSFMAATGHALVPRLSQRRSKRVLRKNKELRLRNTRGTTMTI